MQDLSRSLLGDSSETKQYSCVDNQYRRTFHGPEQRYISPTTGKCRPLKVQAVHPKPHSIDRIEVSVGANTPRINKLAIWLVVNPPFELEKIPFWLMRWAWFTLSLLWPFPDVPRYTGFYPAYLARYYGQLWVSRSPREYSLRKARLGVEVEDVHKITRAKHPRRLMIRESTSWKVCEDEEVIKQKEYVTVSYRYEDVVPEGSKKEDHGALEEAFDRRVGAIIESLDVSAYWIDKLIDSKKIPPDEIDQDVYRMADVYRGAQFTLIILSPTNGITDEKAWMAYGERLWTFPEVLLSRELRFKLGDGVVTPITLHQLAKRAYANFAEEAAIINSYGLKDPLERLERLSLLRSALWRRKSSKLDRIEKKKEAEPLFRADRVYALMGFFEHRIHPHPEETELQALVRLSMANDNDRIVERMVSFLPPKIPNTASWYAEDDEFGSNLWDIEPEVQVVGLTEGNAIVLGGCRAAAIRWKDFPSVAFATQRSVKRFIATSLPYFSWEFFIVGISLVSLSGGTGPVIMVVIGLLLILLGPLLVAYGSSGRIVQAQPWLVGVKGLISAEEASAFMYGGAISSLPRTSYSPSGTQLSEPGTGEFRLGDPKQLDILKKQPEEDTEKGSLYTLVDTLSATIYYFRAAHPPTVCLFMGRESGLGRFVLCSERCTTNELHKETVIRMPWYISQAMNVCDWVAIN